MNPRRRSHHTRGVQANQRARRRRQGAICAVGDSVAPLPGQGRGLHSLYIPQAGARAPADRSVPSSAAAMLQPRVAGLGFHLSLHNLSYQRRNFICFGIKRNIDRYRAAERRVPHGMPRSNGKTALRLARFRLTDADAQWRSGEKMM